MAKALPAVTYPLNQSDFAQYLPTLGDTVHRLEKVEPPLNSRKFVTFYDVDFPFPKEQGQVSAKSTMTPYASAAFKFQEYNSDNRINTLQFRFLPSDFKGVKKEYEATFTVEDSKTKTHKLKTTRSQIQPYWIIERFNEVLRLALNTFFGTRELRTRRGGDASIDVFSILSSAKLFEIINRTENVDNTLLHQVPFLVLSEIQEFLAQNVGVRARTFRGANIFSTAYDKVLMSYVYPNGFSNSSTQVETLGLLRALFLECDTALEAALMTMTKGLWASVRITDNGIPASPLDITFIDLFAGIGSFRKAFESAGARCVWTNDIIPTSMSSYTENFDVGDGELLAGDIRSVIPRHIKERGQGGVLLESLKHIPNTEIDFVLGGFPCKSFSAMGQMARISQSDDPAEVYSKLFLNDPNYGRLIFDTLEIIKQVKAKGFMFENVPEFVNMWVPVSIIDPKTYRKDYGFEVDLRNQKNKKAFDPSARDKSAKKVQACVNLFEAVIIPAFNALTSDGIGFDYSFRVVDARHYGAQSRERVFIIGVRKDIKMGVFDFDKVPFVSKTYTPSFQETMCHIRSEQAEPPYTLPFGKGSIVNPKYNISQSYWEDFKEKVWKQQRTDPNFNTYIPPAGERAKIGPYGKEVLPEDINYLNNLTPRLQERLKYYGTLLAGGINETKFVYYESVVSKGLPVYRMITPREAARLMTFDPDRVTRMPNPTTDTQFYQQCGFSIVTRHLKEMVLKLCYDYSTAKQER